MTKARQEQVSLQETSYYHCMVRCVRRAFLCGYDKNTGKDYSHRKQWIEYRIKLLSSIFSIDVCAYAVLSNHYHVVLHVDVERALSWSSEEVVERWCGLFNGHVLVERWRNGDELGAAELNAVSELIEEYRQRLTDLSWYMRCINEAVARLANEEDGCKGRFWEGRFKSQALLDEGALLTCMTYVDLNPIRAAIAETPETSDFTSIQERLRLFQQNSVKQQTAQKNKTKQSNTNDSTLLEQQAFITDTLKNVSEQSIAYFVKDFPLATLHSFVGQANQPEDNQLPFTLDDYCKLVDWTGRAILTDKKGFIHANVPPIIARMGLNEENWVKSVRYYGSSFYGFVGRVEKIKSIAKEKKKAWLKGLKAATQLFVKTVAQP